MSEVRTTSEESCLTVLPLTSPEQREGSPSTPGRRSSGLGWSQSQSSTSFDAQLSRVSLSSPTKSPSPRNGYLSPIPLQVGEFEEEIADEDDEDGDIGFALPPLPDTRPRSRRGSSSQSVPASIPASSMRTSRSHSLRATPPLEDEPEPSSPRLRTLTRSRTPSPTRTDATRIPPNGDVPRRDSTSSLHSMSDSGQSSRHSTNHSPTHQPDTLRAQSHRTSSRPTFPLGAPIPDEGVDDPSAPFESIPLSSTPPLPPSAVALPTGVPIPTSSTDRGSWSALGATKEGDHFAYGSSTPPHVNGDSHPGIGAAVNGSSGSTSNSSTPTRRHAPPAHPHPFPLPSTPPLSSKRLSTHSSSSSLPRPSSTHSQPQGQAPPHAQMHGLGVKGAPTLDKYLSHTRPPYLPPKDRTEDDSHLQQWEEMMAQSRHLELERRKAQEIRRAEKDRKIAMSTPQWEALLNDPAFSVANVRGNPAMRRLWFNGIPSHLRGKAWGMAVGNPLALSKDAYRFYVSRARKAMDSGRFPAETLDQMEVDMDNTLPVLRMFVRGSPMRADLQDLLCAWVVYRSDEGRGYAPYISYLAAMLLLTSAPTAAFHILINLLSRPLLRAFYTETKDEIEAYYRVFENLQADRFPIIYANCKNLGLRLPEGWFRSLLVEWVPFEAACRLWDQIVLDGDGYVFRAALAIFGFLEPRLYYPDKDEIASVLEGRNRATMAITERERERARLKGEAVVDALDGKLSVFGLAEEALFEWLKDDGWKESRFERLVVREMPD